MLGAVAGNRLGAVRDAKGKSVAAVFNDLGGQQKAEVILSLQVNPISDFSSIGLACTSDEGPWISFVIDMFSGVS